MIAFLSLVKDLSVPVMGNANRRHQRITRSQITIAGRTKVKHGVQNIQVIHYVKKGRLMAIRKKHFSCGHVGKGSFCHACAQKENLRALQKRRKEAQRRQTEERWSLPPSLSFLRDSIEILPYAAQKQKASEILQGILVNKESYQRYHGKRMIYDRAIISVPIGRDWRILLREGQDKSKTFLSILSHEDYNVAKPE